MHTQSFSLVNNNLIINSLEQIDFNISLIFLQLNLISKLMKMSIFNERKSYPAVKIFNLFTFVYYNFQWMAFLSNALDRTLYLLYNIYYNISYN